ncbi:MAG TPA: M14 family zinc carboxypeptidase [Lacibacter sp.]|nr:M14 family zinc carboxypeptidase [Lacibacter sp.]
MKNFSMILLLLVLTQFTFAQEKFQKVEVPFNSLEQRQQIIGLLQLDHFETNGNRIIGVAAASDLIQMSRYGLKYRVLVEDVVAHTLAVNKRLTKDDVTGNAQRAAFQQKGKTVNQIIQTPSLFTPGSLTLGASIGQGYYTYAEMITKMNELATLYPSIVQVFTLAYPTHEGRQIYAMKISDNVTSDENEPEVLYTALQHAREAISGTSMIFFAQYLAQFYASNSEVQSLVNNREIFIVPCVNPDGYVINYTGSNPSTGGGLWRKNRRNNGGSFGVDLNRNYGVDWANCAGATASCGSGSATSDTYWGPSVFSEPESQSIRDFVYSRNIVAAIDQHCFGPYFSLPFGRPSLHTMNAADQEFYKYVPALMGLYNCHRAGNSPETVNYEVAGGIKDWLLLGDIGTGSKGKIYGMTGEAGGGDFWAPVSQIPQLCKELCFQNLQLAFAAGSYFDVQDNNDIAVTSASGSFSSTIRRVGLGNDQLTVSIVPLEGIQSVGAPVTTTINTYYGTATPSISYILAAGIPNGGRIRYIWRVASGGIAVNDTITKFYNPLSLLYDNMEGSLSNNWDVPNGGSAASKWAFTNERAYNGLQSMAENPSGNYTASQNRIVTYNSTFNLSDATAAYLSFWVRHRAENCRDKLQVQVSTNGTTWVNIAGKNTVAEANTTNGGTLGGQPALTGIRENWTREFYDLSSYIGTAALRMRLVFTSDGDASAFAFETDEGFFIDELRVIKSTAIMTTLPVLFINFYGKVNDVNAVNLFWEAYTDNEHDHFVIERSFNGVDFQAIGSYKGFPPYQYQDATPQIGKNYYRIRQVDKNGSITYSKTIELNLTGIKRFTIFPNPVMDRLQIQTNQPINERYTVQITDINGRVVLQTLSNIYFNRSAISIDVTKLTSQLYFLRLLNEHEEVVETHRFIKY